MPRVSQPCPALVTATVVRMQYIPTVAGSGKVDPELLKRLDALMAKFGVVGGEAWKALVRQSYADAFSWLPFLILWCAAATAGVFILRWCFRKIRSDYTEEGWYVAIGLTMLSLVGSGAGIASSVSGMIQILVSPEGHAIRDLLWHV
jgi:hypothetical protein